MKELSLHILDIVQNSTRAQATEVAIEITEDFRQNLLKIVIKDNGTGIKKEMLSTITNPFSTSRTTRRVGLGLSLLKAAAEQCRGGMTIESEEGKGTTVTVTFEHDHIDRVPLGDIVSTLIGIMIGNPAVEVYYRHCVNDKIFNIHTKAIKEELGDVPISDAAVMNFLSEYIQSQIDALYKELS